MLYGYRQIMSCYAFIRRNGKSIGISKRELFIINKFYERGILMVDDRARCEIELMNQLAKVDNEKRIMAILVK